jgi:glycosyltransferase involved in cell wall biosynthesis
MESPNFSIVMASYKRHESLRRLLRGISEHLVDLGTKHEVLVADNAREVNAVTAIDSVINEFRSQTRDATRSVREPRTGKYRAQNLAIRQANGSILAFFDDDVVVTADWLAVVSQFFANALMTPCKDRFWFHRR